MGNKDITYDEFKAHMDKGNKVYMRKPKSWQKIWFWWESKKEKWFLNKAVEKREWKGYNSRICLDYC